MKFKLKKKTKRVIIILIVILIIGLISYFAFPQSVSQLQGVSGSSIGGGSAI